MPRQKAFIFAFIWIVSTQKGAILPKSDTQTAANKDLESNTAQHPLDFLPPLIPNTGLAPKHIVRIHGTLDLQ
jgi:hypothetical protein